MLNAKDHIGMVHKITNKRYNQFKHKYQYDDLFQIGCVGLMMAIKRYDVSKNAKFSTYAYVFIDGYILKSIRDDKWYMGKREERYTLQAPTSLDSFMTNSNNEKDKNTYLDRVLNNDNAFEKAEFRIMISKLPEKLKRIITLRYMKDLTQVQVAKILHITQITVSRNEKKALKILREEMVV